VCFLFISPLPALETSASAFFSIEGHLKSAMSGVSSRTFCWLLSRFSLVLSPHFPLPREDESSLFHPAKLQKTSAAPRMSILGPLAVSNDSAPQLQEDDAALCGISTGMSRIYSHWNDKARHRRLL
jgi:hypothetical protein